jgi:hypothetical protein
MKLKLILIIVVVAVIGSSVVVAFLQSRERAERRRQVEKSHERVSTVTSNYAQTFKLNTNPPIWPDPQKK